MNADDGKNLQAMLDRDAIERLIRDWALWRDTGQWDRLRGCYAPGAVMHTTWFVGGAEEFVQGSMEQAKRGARSAHFMGASTIEVNGERAVAETRFMLLLRASFPGGEVDVTAYARFHDWFLRHAGNWGLRRRIPIYEKDRIDAVTPGFVPALDAAELARYPAAYRHVAYVQGKAGARVNTELPSTGSEATARVYVEGSEWLAGRH